MAESGAGLYRSEKKIRIDCPAAYMLSWVKSNFLQDFWQGGGKKVMPFEVRKARTGQKKRYSKERVIALEQRRKGQTLRQIATHLNKNGYRTTRDKLFQATTVMRLLD